MAKKITNWLIISLILSLGFGQLLRLEYAGLTFYLHDLLVVFLLVLNLWVLPKLEFSKGLKIFLLGLSLGWVNALFNYPFTSLVIPFLYTLRLLAYLTLYSLLRELKIPLKPIYFQLSGAVMVIIGLMQYFLLPDMRWAQYLGWDDHLSRLTLPHFDPTFAGVMLALGLLANLPTTLTKCSSSMTLVPFYLISILLTYARSIYLTLIMTLFLTIKSKKILLISTMVLVLGVALLPVRFGEGTNLLRTYSIASRFDSDLSFVAQYRSQLIVGRGLNTLPLDMGKSIYPNHATGPNNSYLYLLLTTGLLGLIGWGIFLKELYQKSFYKHMLIFFFIASLFNNVMFYPFAILWLLLLESQSST